MSLTSKNFCDGINCDEHNENINLSIVKTKWGYKKDRKPDQVFEVKDHSLTVASSQVPSKQAVWKPVEVLVVGLSQIIRPSLDLTLIWSFDSNLSAILEIWPLGGSFLAPVEGCIIGALRAHPKALLALIHFMEKIAKFFPDDLLLLI